MASDAASKQGQSLGFDRTRVVESVNSAFMQQDSQLRAEVHHILVQNHLTPEERIAELLKWCGNAGEHQVQDASTTAGSGSESGIFNSNNFQPNDNAGFGGAGGNTSIFGGPNAGLPLGGGNGGGSIFGAGGGGILECINIKVYILIPIDSEH
jgi:hypothetical protein